MDLFTAIDTRASALKISGPAPSHDHLQRIMDAGARAPDHGQLAPWRMVVLGEQARAKLGALMADALAARDANADDEQLQRERNKPTRAPAIIAVGVSITRHHKVPESEQVMAVAAAVQNMMLAAHALGYGAMWKTGPASRNEEIKAMLGLQADDHVVAFLYLGTAITPGMPRGVMHKQPVRWME